MIVMKVRYEFASDVERLAKKIAKRLCMTHLDFSRIKFIRSYGSKSRAVARCYGLARIWQHALGIKAHYVIEVIAEKFDKLSKEEKEKVIIHELLHIPKSFGGGLRGHDYVTRKRVESLHKKFKRFF